jgi:hypothetical protein
MADSRRQLALWSRTAFWFVVLCSAIVIVQFGAEEEEGSERFELDQADGVFNASFQNQLESGPVSPAFLRQAILMVEHGLKNFEARTKNEWNDTTSRSEKYTTY